MIYNGDDMKSIYDIQQLLMKFGTVIYIGDRIADLELMEMEIRELYKSQFVSDQDFQMAILLLRQEISKVQKARGEG
nr:YqgQ family protein [Pontibacillus salipaludis]